MLGQILAISAVRSYAIRKQSQPKCPNWNPTLNAAHHRAKNAWHYWKRANKPTDPLHHAKYKYKIGVEGIPKTIMQSCLKTEILLLQEAIDMHASNSEKLFHLLRNHGNTQPAPTGKLVFEGAEYYSENIHNGWVVGRFLCNTQTYRHIA